MVVCSSRDEVDLRGDGPAVQLDPVQPQFTEQEKPPRDLGQESVEARRREATRIAQAGTATLVQVAKDRQTARKLALASDRFANGPAAFEVAFLHRLYHAPPRLGEPPGVVRPTSGQFHPPCAEPLASMQRVPFC